MHDPLPPNCWICTRRPAAADEPALPFEHVCRPCAAATDAHRQAWRLLAAYLRRHWNDITARGAFDLTKAFPTDTATRVAQVHLFFVKVLGGRLAADNIAIDLASFSSSLLTAEPHPEISLLVADARVSHREFVSYDSSVSVLRSGTDVQSAMWLYLDHPIAIKICYLQTGAPVRPPPDGHPWHPLRQRKVVKLSPYKGEVQPTLARRDLRI